MAWTDLMTGWAAGTRDTLPCGCTQLIVETLEETLACPRRWEYWPGVGWVHTLKGPE